MKMSSYTLDEKIGATDTKIVVAHVPQLHIMLTNVQLVKLHTPQSLKKDNKCTYLVVLSNIIVVV